MGLSKLTNSVIPASFEYYWQPPPPVYDPAQAKKLLAEAGFADGFDAGDYYCDVVLSRMSAKRCSTILQEVGIRTKLRPIERAAFLKGYAREDATRTLSRAAAAPSATPPPGSKPSSSRAAPMSMAAIPRSTRCSRSRRANSTPRSAAAILEKMQQLVHEKSDYRADLAAWLSSTALARGSAKSGFGLITGFAYTAPYEDITIKGS